MTAAPTSAPPQKHHPIWRRRAVLIATAIVFVYFVYPYFLPDRVLMWETTSINSGRASTGRATKAAKRFFDRTDLRGKTREEIVSLTGDPRKSSDSIYKHPFHPIERSVMVYRFDTGFYGWQFNIYFGDDNRATHIEHKWIH